MSFVNEPVVVITGGTAGIGLAVAHQFAREKATVIVIARGIERLERVVEEIRMEGGSAMGIPGDVGSREGIDQVLVSLREYTEKIDILVNNAALHHRGNVLSNSPSQLADMIRMNLEAPVYLTRTLLPHLTAPGGAIVNVASLAGCVPVAGSATYSASKFGLRAFSYALREELQPVGIQVACVSPGPVSTGFILDSLEEVTDLTLSQPMSTPEAVAAAVVRCARGDEAELKLPRISGYLTTGGYLFPGLGRILKPFLRKKGARVKARLHNQIRE